MHADAYLKLKTLDQSLMKKFPIWQCILLITLHVHVYKYSSSVIFMSENIETLNALFRGSCMVMNVVSICNWHKLKKLC